MAKPTKEVHSILIRIMRKAAPGPGNWASQEDLLHLEEWYGQACSFHSVTTLAEAAQLRVITWENHRGGGLAIESKMRELDIAVGRTKHLDRLIWWANWRKTAVVQTLFENRAELEGRGITVGQILQNQIDKTDKGPKDWTPKGIQKAKGSFQRNVRTAIKNKNKDTAIDRVRDKIVRWELPPNHRTAAERALRHLRGLKGGVAPRVSAAVLSTIWNRWCTARRHQCRHTIHNRCLLGCPGHAEDSIEHYARCPVVKEYHARALRIREEWLLPGWVGTEFGMSEDKKTLYAVGALAVYTTTNQARHTGKLSREEALHALVQAGKEAVVGHEQSMEVLRTVGAIGNGKAPDSKRGHYTKKGQKRGREVGYSNKGTVTRAAGNPEGEHRSLRSRFGQRVRQDYESRAIESGPCQSIESPQQGKL